MKMSFADIGEAVVVLIVTLGFLLFCGYAGQWRHRWKYKHNPRYREDHDRYQARYRLEWGKWNTGHSREDRDRQEHIYEGMRQDEERFGRF
jgi:hypothetical protein